MMRLYIKIKGERQMEIILGGVAFVVLFSAWVIVPVFIKKRHTAELEESLD